MPETARLWLRRWTPGDCEPFARINQDPLVMEYLPAPLSRVESDAMIDRIEAGFDQHGFGLWAVETSGELIGFVGLSVPSFRDCVEVGWRLGSAHWGKGYATEAARAALAYGFANELEEIVSFTVAANLRSVAVMERIGMHRNPGDDFDHPRLPAGHPLSRHLLYRIRR
jgi:RimJ/RimL family protein N-acetyltransferase